MKKAPYSLCVFVFAGLLLPSAACVSASAMTPKDEDTQTKARGFIVEGDQDKDGRISRAEFSKMMKKSNPNAGPEDEAYFSILFDRFDKNGDGYIVEYEAALFYAKQ